ncbi:hypothetical protein F66182_8126 [Fusarium sp. NRRL 66182]|nr:hypothetical protein F66182_8126 [Fusarium sp. NRRL 66182]
MVSLQFILLALLAIPSSANPAPQRKLACTNPKVKSFSSSAHKVASKQVKTFCSSYLRYRHKTRTVTETHTWDDWEYTTVYSGTGTLVLQETASATGTWIHTQTVGVFPDLKKRHVPEKREPAYAPPPAPTKRITADRQGKALGYPASVVSGACSCLVKPPTTKTTTTTSPLRRITEWVTVSEYAATTTTTTTTTDTHYSYTTEEHTKTYANPTDCGTPAQPTFFVQLREADVSRTDGYNNFYLSVMQSSGAGQPNVTSDKKRAVLVYLEASTGYLRTVDGGLYLNNDPYSPLTLLRFHSKAWLDAREWRYNVCKIVQAGKEDELTRITAVSSRILGRIAIHAALHPSCDGKINMLDRAEPTTFADLWPSIASYFGLVGVAPSGDGSALPPSEYIETHKHLFRENEKPCAIKAGVGAGRKQLDSVGWWLTFDRQLSAGRLREVGFAEERDPAEGWTEAFDTFREAGIIP